MMIRLTHEGCRQIEMVVHDVPKAVAFMERTLGAQKIEQGLATMTTGYVLHLDHVDCGQGMFQFCSLITDDQPHKRYIESFGPCAMNLNFGVVDQPEAERAIVDAGGSILTRFPLSGIPWVKLLGADNVRPDAEMGEGLFTNTHELLGFDLEISQSPWKDFHKQTALYPAYRKNRPETHERVELLLRLRVVVNDLDKMLANVQRLFEPSGYSPVYGHLEDAEGISAKIRLDGLELEYCQPTGPGAWQDYLSRYEPGITTAVFSVKDLDAVIDAIPAADRELTQGAEFKPRGAGKRGYRLHARPITGIDIELLQLD